MHCTYLHSGSRVVPPQPGEQPDEQRPLRLPGPRGIAEVPRPLQQPDRQDRGPLLPSKKAMRSLLKIVHGRITTFGDSNHDSIITGELLDDS